MSGGAICANYGAGSGGLQVANCEFNENATSSEGGAISILTGQHPQLSIHIDSCKFMNGYSYHSSSGLSMVNYCPNLDFRLSNSLFYKNKSVFNSGAIYITSGGKRPVIENCVFQENQTELDITSPGIGGAILGSGYRLVNCSFIGNKARIGAVAVVGNVEFVGCLFANNSAVLEAGVLRNSSSCKLINCTFLNNYAGEKGGVIRSFLTSLSDTIVNCIFINNKSGQSGDNIYPNALTKIYMSHCMVDVSDCSTLEMATNPPVDFLTCGPGMLFNVYPRFRDTASGDYRLDACSPLIDQGDGAWALRFGLSADLEGSSRLQNTNIDIGAYETPKLLAEATT